MPLEPLLFGPARGVPHEGLLHSKPIDMLRDIESCVEVRIVKGRNIAKERKRAHAHAHAGKRMLTENTEHRRQHIGMGRWPCLHAMLGLQKRGGRILEGEGCRE